MKTVRARVLSCVMFIVVTGFAFVAFADGKAPSDAKTERACKDAEDAVTAARKAVDQAAENPVNPGLADVARNNAEKLLDDAQKADWAAQDARNKADKSHSDADRKTAKQLEKDAKEAKKAAAQADSDALKLAKDENAANKRGLEAKRLKGAARRNAADKIRFAKLCAEFVDKSSTQREEEKAGFIKKIEELENAFKQLAAAGPAGNETIASMAASGKVQVTLTGTGKTIGHMIDMTVKNLTAETLPINIPPMVYTSKSGKKQPAISIKGQTGTLKPGETTTFAVNAVCGNGRLPPAGPSDVGELVMSDPTPTQVQLIKDVSQITLTAKQFQRDKVFTTPFAADPPKELDTVVQWSVWLHTSKLEGNPITKTDLAKKVREQTGTLTPQQSTQLDAGIDQIWTAVQLVGAKLVDQPGNIQMNEGDNIPPADGAGKTAPEEVKPEGDTPTEIPGFVKGPDGKWRNVPKPKDEKTDEPAKPEESKEGTGRWETAPEEDGKKGIKGPDGKIIRDGEPDYEKAKKALEEQERKDKSEAARKAKEEKKQAIKDQMLLEEANHKARQDYDKPEICFPAWETWQKAKPGRRREETKPGEFDYYEFGVRQNKEIVRQR